MITGLKGYNAKSTFVNLFILLKCQSRLIITCFFYNSILSEVLLLTIKAQHFYMVTRTKYAIFSTNSVNA